MSSQNSGSIQHINGNKDNSCIVHCSKKLQVLVPPLYCNNLKKGIIQALDKLTEGYCEELGGLVISYKNVQVDQDSGCIHSTNPFIHFLVKADFEVFIPTEGFCIEGVVNEVSNYKVSFLAYNKFNVVYRTRDVQHKLHRVAQLKQPNAATCRAALDHLEKVTPGLKEGDTCTLLLHEVALRDFLPHLRGYPVPEGLDTSSLLCEATEQSSLIKAPPATDGSASRKVRFSDQESEGSDMADTSLRDIQLLTPPTSHEERTSDSDEDPSVTEPANLSLSGKNKKKNKHGELGSKSIKQEKLSPPKGLDLPDCGRIAVHDSDESSVEEEALAVPSPPPPPPPQGKKKKKRSNAVGGSDGGVVDIRTLEKIIKNSMLPEPTSDYLNASGGMIPVKKEILDVAEVNCAKRKNKHREAETGIAMDFGVCEELPNAVTTKKKKKKKDKSEQLTIDENALSAAVAQESTTKKSKKRKNCEDSEQVDGAEMLKPSKKKRKLNS